MQSPTWRIVTLLTHHLKYVFYVIDTNICYNLRIEPYYHVLPCLLTFSLTSSTLFITCLIRNWRLIHWRFSPKMPCEWPFQNPACFVRWQYISVLIRVCIIIYIVFNQFLLTWRVEKIGFCNCLGGHLWPENTSGTHTSFESS